MHFSRKESLLDIAVRMNTEQQDTKPPSGGQPKERTILILGSKGVVSIAFMALSLHCYLQVHAKYNQTVRSDGKAVTELTTKVCGGVQALLYAFSTLTLDRGERSGLRAGGALSPYPLHSRLDGC